MEKDDEHRERFLWIFKKLVLRIRDGKENPIYLIRYTLFTCKLFSIKLHRIFLSDDDCMHDHPWSFLSIILWGGYYECRPFIDNRERYSDLRISNHSLIGRVNWHSAGSILWRPAPSIHKLIIPECRSATTLVITLKKRFDWGFYTPSGWVFWKEYIRSGAKCE